ncbi:hypothetical protein ZWY2020_052671 [Hordeum vulgare]|nr:hypothetical protein ZWY2020_052671 [Hordeum vulgare]
MPRRLALACAPLVRAQALVLAPAHAPPALSHRGGRRSGWRRHRRQVMVRRRRWWGLKKKGVGHAPPVRLPTDGGELRVLDIAAKDGASMLLSSHTTTWAAPRGGYEDVILDSGSLQGHDNDELG